MFSCPSGILKWYLCKRGTCDLQLDVSVMFSRERHSVGEVFTAELIASVAPGKVVICLLWL